MAIGDVHGDIDGLLITLYCAELINENGDWIGGNTIVIQCGDQIDRKRNNNMVNNNVKPGWGIHPELEVLQYTEWIHSRAQVEGGAFYSLLGNHEVQNVYLTTRYARYKQLKEDSTNRELSTEENDEMNFIKNNEMNFLNNYVSAADMTDWGGTIETRLHKLTAGTGLMAKFFAKRPVVLVIDDNWIFSHADIAVYLSTNKHFRDKNDVFTVLEKLNEDVFNYLNNGIPPPDIVFSDKEGSPLWSRNVCTSCLNAQLNPQHMKLKGFGFTFVAGHSTQFNIKYCQNANQFCIDTQRSLAFADNTRTPFQHYLAYAQSLIIFPDNTCQIRKPEDVLNDFLFAISRVAKPLVFIVSKNGGLNQVTNNEWEDNTNNNYTLQIPDVSVIFNQLTFQFMFQFQEREKTIFKNIKQNCSETISLSSYDLDRFQIYLGDAKGTFQVNLDNSYELTFVSNDVTQKNVLTLNQKYTFGRNVNHLEMSVQSVPTQNQYLRKFVIILKNKSSQLYATSYILKNRDMEWIEDSTENHFTHEDYVLNNSSLPPQTTSFLVRSNTDRGILQKIVFKGPE